MNDYSRHLYRILIVDGGGPFSELWRTLLQGPDRSVEVCDTVHAAQELLLHYPVDVAILHPTRSVAGHNALARQIVDRNPHAQVIVCTNHVRLEPGADARVLVMDKVNHQHSRRSELMHLASSSKVE
jgi:DNA-binding NtrC family response regulator